MVCTSRCLKVIQTSVANVVTMLQTARLPPSHRISARDRLLRRSGEPAPLERSSAPPTGASSPLQTPDSSTFPPYSPEDMLASRASDNSLLESGLRKLLYSLRMLSIGERACLVLLTSTLRMPSRLHPLTPHHERLRHCWQDLGCRPSSI